jgi:hypothetical protein
LLLLAGPTVLAFFAGGYFAGPRAWAGLLVWLLVIIGTALGTGGLPRNRGAVLALGGLAAFAALSLLSMLWAPVVSDAYHAGQIAVLYLGTLCAAALLLGGDEPARLVEPALLAGATIVIGYGLSERFLPGLLHFSKSVSAQGRLEQPLTYWNAMGELAAVGVVLAARLAGDSTRRPWLRVSAAALVAPLGMGLYISFSRGALFACAAGLLTLVCVAPRREQLAAILLSILTVVLAAVVAAPFGGLTELTGSLSSRERGGAISLVLLVLVMAGAAVAQHQLRGRVKAGELRLPRRAPTIAAAAVCVGLAAAILLGAKESSASDQAPLGGGSARLVTLQSNRYDYWRVALRAFGTEPITGVGAGNWNVYWLRWRKRSEFAQDAHSLPLQTLAELGLLGAGALILFLVGVTVAARTALRLSSAAAGPIAGFVAYLAHSPLDWDWEMPAVTLLAMVLAGSLLAQASGRRASQGRQANKIHPADMSRLQPAAGELR